jgi:hypothetical protein
VKESHATPLFRRLVGRLRVTPCLLAVPVAALLCACGTSARRTSALSAPVVSDVAKVSASVGATAGSQAGCGAIAAATLATTDGLVAMQIYKHELSGPGVRADRRQVEGYGPLLSALAVGNQAGVRQAVTGLVYSHTHIVRLRVIRGSAVLADVGGPYIIAPVSGELRFRGRTVGHYVLSVQDDLGYVKLETRYMDLPLVLQMGALRLPLEGTLAPGPANIPSLGAVAYQGTSYEVFSFNALAFPHGTLRISLFVPAAGSLSAKSCTAIRLSGLGRIAKLVWDRYSLVAAPSSAYVNQVRGLTGGLTYVRSGTRQLAGSTSPGPTGLPVHGTLRYRGVTWQVSSFPARVATAPVRVYVLMR